MQWKGGQMMEKREPKKQSFYEFNEQGANEVSEQIMNSYNSGVIDQGTFKAESEENVSTEG